MSAVDVVLQVFRSVEERNPRLAAEVYHDDLEFHWPRPLPYAGSSYGLTASLERRPGWAETWNPFQGEGERGLGAHVVASSGDEVVCCGISTGAIAPAGRLTPRFWASIRFATESSPAPRCSTSIRSRLPNSWHPGRCHSTPTRVDT